MVDCKEIWSEKNIDFEENFLPLVNISSIQIVLSLVASMKLEIEELNVKIAFFHNDLEEKIYME